MSGYQAALDYLSQVNGTAPTPEPMPGGTPAQAAQRIDFETPLPEMSPAAAPLDDSLAFPQDIENSLAPLEEVNAATETAAPPQTSRSNGYSDALAFLNRQADQAATQQAVTEATTPDDRLPIISPDLADALGVLDYRDPQEGQRRQQAAAVGEILNLPMFERVNLGAAPVNADGTVTIRRAQAVSPEAQAAADEQMEIIRRDAAAEMNPPNRAVEAYNRAERGARLGVEDVRTGFYSIVEDFFRPQQNPYLEKSQAAAIEDVPKLESRLADLQSRQAEFTKGDLGPNRDRISPFDDEISSIQNQLAKARQATTGEPVTENFLGSLSRASGDLSAEARENQQAIAADYTPEQIRPERNKEFWMTVADSLGRSAPTTASAILNPYLGLTLGYTQVFSNSESEFDQAAAQTGKPIDPEARAEYAHSQAVLQTPFELVGDLALAKVARDSIAASGKALMRSVKAGDPGAVTSFVSNLPRRAGQLAAAAAGETLITTPAQTVIEQKLAEAEGVRAPISNAELAARTGQAMQVAGAQSLLLGGGPVALETGVTTIADGIAARRQAPTTPTAPMGTPSSPTAPPSSATQPAPGEVPQNFTPISSPAPATGPVAPATAPQNLGQVRAPEIPIDQAALDEAFGSPFAPPQPAPADPFAPTPAPAAVNPQVNPAPVSNDTSAQPATPAPAPATISIPASIAPTDWESAIRSAPRVPMFPGDPQRRQTVSAIPILSQANATPGMAVVAINGRPGTVTDQRDSMGLVVQMDDGTTERMNAFTTFHLQSDVVPFLKAPQQSGSQQTPSPSSTPPAATIQPAPRNAAEAAQLREEQAQAQLPGVMEGFGAGARHGTALRVEQSPLTISSPQAVQIVIQNPNDYEFTTNQDGSVIISGAFDPVDNVWRGKPKTKPQPTRVVPSQVVVGDTIQLGGSPRLVTSVSNDKGTTTIVATNPETGTQQTLSGSDRMLEVEVVSRAQAPQPPAQQSTATTSTPTTPSPITVSTDWLSSFTEKPQAQQAARDWWRTNRPEPVEVSHPKFDTPIVVSWQGVKHATRNSAGLDELATVPFIQDAIANSEWVGQAPDKRKRNTIQAVHELRAPILLNNKLKDLRIVVRQTTSGTLFYDHSYIKPTEPAVTSEEPGSQDSDQQAASSTSPNTQSPPSVNPPDLQNTESDFEASMRNAMRRNRQSGFVDIQAVQEFGKSIYQAGKSFAQWSGEMVRKFGETIRDVLETIWQYVSGQQFLPQARERGSVAVPGKATGSSKPRSFPQTVTAAPGVAPEVKAQLTALDYDPISNAQTVATARARIDAAGSMDAALSQLSGKSTNRDFQPTAVDYAVAIELLGELQARGRYQDAGALADFMASAATAQGQAIQALSLISRLTPAGIEVFAARQLQRAARNDPKIEQLIEDNERLRGEIATAKRDSATAAIVGRRAEIKAALPAGADAVATNIAIREAILQSPTPLAAQAATARILQDNGLSERAASRIAQSITKDFLKTTIDSRAKVLQDLLALAEKDRRLNKSKLGALIRLNREGKLSDSRLHADMAKMLGIPAWTAEHSAKVQRLINERERATDPRVKLVKAAEALDVIYREAMPPGILDKIDTYQTMAMLLNGLTQVRNLVGNISMAGVEIASDTVAQALDAVVGLGTGQRTRTGLDLGTRLTELGAGFQDIRAGYQFARAEGKGRRESFKEGVQTLIRLGRIYSSGKYDSQELTRYTGPVFNNPVMQTLENTLGAALSLADRGFYESAFKASLQNRMRTAAQNGTPMLAPDPDMIEQARMDAARAIYQDENIASKGFSGIRRVLNANKRWGLGSMVLKFTQVPGSILVRGLEFTPINTIRVLYETVAPLLPRTVGRYHIGKDFDQKAFTDAFARSLIGTGFLATGYWLAHLGILSGGMDSDDENERELAKAEGWGPYRINVSALQRAMVTGNFWTRQPRLKTDKVVKYDWLAPMSIGVAMGANMREGKDKILKEIQAGKRTSDFATTANWLLAAAGETAGVTVSAMNTVLEQPMLSNLNQLFVTAGHSDPISALVKTAADIPGTMIPTVVKQWARYEDNIVRETRDGYDGKLKFRQTVNELKAMLPGVSKTLPPRYDMEGNPVERFPNNGNTFFNVALNPAFVGYIKKSKLLSEMSDVYKATADGGVVPSRIPAKVSLENVEITLMPDEISALQKEYGMLSVAAAEKFVFSDPYYEKATWEQRAHALQKALTMAAKAAKYRVLQSRPDLYQRAKAEHIQRMESQRAANQQAQQDLAAVSQAINQLQPGP